MVIYLWIYFYISLVTQQLASRSPIGHSEPEILGCAVVGNSSCIMRACLTHTPHARCVSFAVVATSHVAYSVPGERYSLPGAGLPLAGPRELGLADPIPESKKSEFRVEVSVWRQVL